MRETDVRPSSAALNFHIDQDIAKGITWNFRLEPEADSEISVTTGEPPRASVRASDMKAAVRPDGVDVITNRVLSLLKRSQPALPDRVVEQARQSVTQWVQSQWRFFEWLHRDTRKS